MQNQAIDNQTPSQNLEDFESNKYLHKKKPYLKKNRLKYFISILGFLVILVGVVATYYLSQKNQDNRQQASETKIKVDLAINPGRVSAKKGDLIPLQLIYQAFQYHLTAAEIKLTYDPSLIEVLEIIPHDLSLVLSGPEIDNGKITFAFAVPLEEKAKTGQGALATIKTKLLTDQTASINFDTDTKITIKESVENVVGILSSNPISNLKDVSHINECGQGYDVIINAGQSNNLTGRVGNSEIDSYGERIFQYGRGENNNKIIPAIEPLAHHQSPPKTIGYVGTFAKLYRDNNLLEKDRCVLILPAAKGGSSFSGNEWNPRDIYAEDLVVRAQNIMADSKNRIVAMLWHQGEGDAQLGMNYADYKHSFYELIKYLDKEIKGFSSATTPILIGQMVPSWINTKGKSAQDIDYAHQALAREKANINFVSASEPYELGKNDEQSLGLENDLIHYSATSQRELGKRYFNQYISNY